MVAVKTYTSDSDAQKAVMMLKKAGVSGFMKKVNNQEDDDNSFQPGVQVHVVEDALIKAHQVLDIK